MRHHSAGFERQIVQLVQRTWRQLFSTYSFKMSYTAEAANNGCCVISVILFDRAILHAIYLILFSALHNIRTM